MGVVTTILALVFVVVVSTGLVLWGMRRKDFNGNTEDISIAVRWFPRAMRPWVNKVFAEYGLALPYDEHGNKIPCRQRKLPDPPET